MDSGVRWPPPLIVLGGLVLGGLLDTAVLHWMDPPLWGTHLPVPARLPGLLPLLLGGGLALWAVLRILLAGTPLLWFRLAETLIRDGPFAWSRNPIYTGLLLAYTGLAILLGAWITLLLGVAVFRLLRDKVVRIEEQRLAAHFGAPYREYCQKVRRWL